MDYIGYLIIGTLVLGGVFFVLAIYYFNYQKDQFKATRFTAYGFFVFAVCSLVSFWTPNPADYRLTAFCFIVFSYTYYWLSRSIRKQKR